MSQDDSWQPIDINVRQVIKDFLEGYSAEPEEVMLVESVANSLDAGARNIRISLWRTENGDFYSISDDGAGMTEQAFKHSYHALALSSKAKGDTIGFAGVGGKLYLAMLEAGNSIYTETKSITFSGASELTMIGDNVKWREVPSRGKIRGGTGTYVELKLRPSSNLDWPTAERIIQDNYNAILLGLYGKKSITVSWKPGSPLPPWKPATESEDEESFTLNKIKCTCHFWLAQDEFDNERGFDIVILGKRIKISQWFDIQFKIDPRFSNRICGLITSDPLAKLLTTNKQDLKVGHEKTWLAYKKEVDEKLMSWLGSIGAIREAPKSRSEELAAASQVSEMINRMLKFPGLDIYNPFLKKTLGETAIKSDKPDSFIKDAEGSQNVTGMKGSGSGGNGVATLGPSLGKGVVSSDEGYELGERVTRRLRSGVIINLDSQEKNSEEGWVTPEAIVVNKGHPIYKKFQSLGYTHETNNIFRCAVTALIENADPTKKPVFDELRRFYNGWASLA